MSNCVFVGNRCTTHNEPRCGTMNCCETGFYDPADWKDMMTDEQHRDAMRSDVRNAIETLGRALSWQLSKIREKTAEDHADESFIREALTRLGACTKSAEKPAKRRRKP